MAKQRELSIVEEFSDAVESGKDEDRPGFQSLITAVRNRARGWDILLLHDTSRLSRRRLISIIFEESDCRRNGVQVIYKTLPDADPITEMMLKSMMQAMDEYHSLMSRQKGLAGMAENVRQGFRAGGRAPRGYKLRRVHTGAIRDGDPVAKSVLELDPVEAPKVQAYLAARANGSATKQAAENAQLPLSFSSLVGLEWNALVYAGHTIWNVTAEREGGAYIGGSKRRPRTDWVIQRDTHPALISDEDAEGLLARLETNAGRRQSKTRHRGDAMLSGLLVCPQGKRWHSEGNHYRLSTGGGARTLVSHSVESAVIDQVMSDIAKPELIELLVESTRATLASGTDTKARDAAHKELATIERKIARQMELAGEMTTPAPALRRIEELEGMRIELTQAVSRMDREVAQAKAAQSITAADVRRVLAQVAEDAKEGGRDAMRSLLVTLLEKVVLDPATTAGVLHYRVGGSAGAGFSWRPHGDANLTPAIVLRAQVPFQVRTRVPARRFLAK